MLQVINVLQNSGIFIGQSSWKTGQEKPIYQLANQSSCWERKQEGALVNKTT